MSDPPTGTVTFLFSEIENAAGLRQRLGERYADLVAEHGDLLRAVFLAQDGHAADDRGDALLAAFPRPEAAIAAAIAGQRALASHPWSAGGTVRVRMGLHTGEPVRTAGGYVGIAVHRAARICAAGHAGQVLLSSATADLVADRLPSGVVLRDLGRHKLAGLAQSEWLFQLAIPGLLADFPELRSLTTHPANLPVPPTRLIDREQEVAALCELVLRDDVRLVTITGPGGAGKTRLAIEIATRLADKFDDGVTFVPLESIRDPQLVPSVIAQAFGVREGEGPQMLDRLKGHLQDQAPLLVVDNFEQLSAAAWLVADLLAACPRLKLLVTSRAKLHLRGEHEFVVPPLTVPHPHDLSPATQLSEYPAIQLFAERARAAQAGFALTGEAGATILEICYRLDGLPLAIELAAARLKVLSPPGILARLERRLVLLTGGPRDLPARQQTMRDTVAWSHDLLDPDERALFRRLSVFAGGCTLDAVEAVYEAIGEPEAIVLDGLAALVDHSLLNRHEHDLSPRFVMLGTIQEYAAEQLDLAGDTAAVRSAHLRYFRRLAREAERQLRGTEQLAWVQRLETELDNIRSALAWSLEHAESTEDGLALAAALTPFWWSHHMSEGSDWFLRLLGTGAAAGKPLRALALYSAAILAHDTSGLAVAMPLLEESVALCQSLGIKQLYAMAVGMQGRCRAYLGEHEQAQRAVDECVAIIREFGDPWQLALTLGWHGDAAARRGDDSTARASWEESISLFRSVGEQSTLAGPIGWLAEIAYRQGDYATARRQSEESIAIWQRTGNMVSTAHHLGNLGLATLAQGERELAEASFRESLMISTQAGRELEVPPALVGLAAVSKMQGQGTRAVRLLGAAGSLGQTLGVPLAASFAELRARLLEDTRAQLGGAAFAAAWAAGQGMTSRQAAVYALVSEEPTSGTPAPAAHRQDAIERAGLTEREVQILRLVAAGHSSKEIAGLLHITVPTVNRHIANIYNKITARGRADAIAWALRHGLGETQ